MSKSRLAYLTDAERERYAYSVDVFYTSLVGVFVFSVVVDSTVFNNLCLVVFSLVAGYALLVGSSLEGVNRRRREDDR